MGHRWSTVQVTEKQRIVMDADGVGKQSDHDHSDHFIGLLVDNAILKAQVSLQRESE